MATTAFDRTDAQRHDALERANAIRSGRAEVKRELRRGHRDLAETILRPPACLSSMPVFDLIQQAPRIGGVKALGILNRTRVSPTRRVDGLTERERGVLVSLLPHGGGR